MGLDKGIASGKEKRKPYHGGGACDRTCRPGGSCPYCKGNRMHSDTKRKLSARDQMKEAVASVLTEAAWNSPNDPRRMRDGEDLSVPVDKRLHNTHPQALARRTSNVRLLEAIIEDLHALADRLTKDGYEQRATMPYHVKANELSGLLRSL